MRYLSGLDPKFDYLRRQFLGSEEIPSLASVYARIQTSFLPSISIDTSGKTAFTSQSSGNLPFIHLVEVVVDLKTRNVIGKGREVKGLYYFDGSSSSPIICSTVASPLQITIPKIVSEAISHPGWRKEMEEEMRALELNGTWDLVLPPDGNTVVGCRWIFTIKMNSDGMVETLKARLVVKGYTHVYDVDWAGSFDRRFISGYCVFVGGNIVSWKCKKKTVVVRSSIESEYRAMTHTTCELVWLKQLLGELGFQQSRPMDLFCDNQVVVHIASNPVFHERTKHIEVDCHFVRDKLQENTIQKSEDQLADLFTKSLGGNRVRILCNKLG
ncbi:transmembrane signal receptor [Lithospermum erythrorhizon]|uniref:Transmembrane signal receptor n=1 Tax=Lithospermum erythrorhizon TaxID=34254 RepID=A0AAV3R0B6_LITER